VKGQFEHGCFTHAGDPTKDIGIKANMVLRNVYAPLNEDLTLQGTTIVCIVISNRRASDTAG
jgi:hypothetical protein